jgi:hypothetical protein
MTRRLIVIGVVMVLAVALMAAPAVADSHEPPGTAPPGLHKAPAALNAPPHVVCVRCHMDPTGLGPCMGAGCHGGGPT